MVKYFSAFVFVVTMVTSCGTSEKAMKAQDAKENALFNRWLNHNKSELVHTWGQPDSTISDGKRGQILIYKEGIDFKSVMNERYTGKQFSFRKEMFVNADSTIYYWKAWRRK